MSLLSHILSTNNALSDSDAGLIHQMVVARTEELAMLDLHIAELRKVVGDLKRARRGLQEHITHCKTALAPIRRLPTEVLADILQLVPEKSYNHDGLVVARESPLPLAQICDRWRSITFSIPTLWSFVDVTLSKRLESYLTNRRREVELHLSLSKDAPLSIVLSSDYNDKIADWESFIRALVPCFHRCQFIHLDIAVPALACLEQYAGSFSNLQGIRFHGKVPFFTDTPQACHTFSNVHTLRMASIWGIYNPDHLFLPWSQLTRLDLTMLADECIIALEQAVNIEECRLYFFPDISLDPISSGRITLPHLRALHIAGDQTGLIFLDYVSAPVLEILSCWIDVGDPISEDFMNLNDFAARTQTIKKLSLHGSWFSCYFFIETLQLQNLCELCIHDWNRPTCLPHSERGLLIYDESDDDIRDLGLAAPRLEKLTISIWKDDPSLLFKDDVLLDMIASRRNIKAGGDVAQIQSVTFVDARFRDKTRPRLKKMREGGLEVVFLKSAATPWVWDGGAPESRYFENFGF
jgi:hypothetical protein